MNNFLSWYDPRNWHWVIGSDGSRAWSTASSSYVAEYPSDAVTRIASEAELRDVLRPYGIRGPGADAVDVTAERDRRLMVFPYAGKLFNFVDGKGSDLNVAGAGTMALAAIVAGAQAGDLRWAYQDRDFTWIAADNTLILMDAFQALAFAKAAGVWKERHIFAARTLKDASPIPGDYTSDNYWPTA